MQSPRSRVIIHDGNVGLCLLSPKSEPTEPNRYPNLTQSFEPRNPNLYSYHYPGESTRPNDYIHLLNFSAVHEQQTKAPYDVDSTKHCQRSRLKFRFFFIKTTTQLDYCLWHISYLRRFLKKRNHIKACIEMYMLHPNITQQSPGRQELLESALTNKTSAGNVPFPRKHQERSDKVPIVTTKTKLGSF